MPWVPNVEPGSAKQADREDEVDDDDDSDEENNGDRLDGVGVNDPAH